MFCYPEYSHHMKCRVLFFGFFFLLGFLFLFCALDIKPVKSSSVKLLIVCCERFTVVSLRLGFRGVDVWVFCLHVWLCTMGRQCPQRPEGTGPPGAGVTDGCAPPFGCWEPLLSPVKTVTVLSPVPITAGRLSSPLFRDYCSRRLLRGFFPLPLQSGCNCFFFLLNCSGQNIQPHVKQNQQRVIILPCFWLSRRWFQQPYFL